MSALLAVASIGLIALVYQYSRCGDNAGQNQAREPLPMTLEVKKLADQLATHKRVESPRVGVGARPSSVYAIAESLLAQASREEEQSLLRHPSPVVRYYLAEHYVSAYPQRVRDVFFLLTDNTRVAILSGDVGFHVTLASNLQRRLCDQARREDVRTALTNFLFEWPDRQDESSAAMSPTITGQFYRCLVPYAVPGLLARTRRALMHSQLYASRPERDILDLGVSGFLETLALTGSVDDMTLIKNYQDSPNPYERAAVAFAHGVLQPTDARDELEWLASDEERPRPRRGVWRRSSNCPSPGSARRCHSSSWARV